MKKSVLFVAILFFASCSKSLDDKQRLSVRQNLRVIAAGSHGSSTDPSNPENPYDSVGMVHNIIIRALLDHVHKSKDTSRANRRLFVIAYGKKLRNIDARNAIQAVDRVLMSCNADLEKLLNFKNVSRDCRRDIIQISIILQKIKNGSTYESVRKEIIDLEATVARRSYPEHERRAFFIAASVARHSAFIWNPDTAIPRRFFLIDWGVAVVEYFANVHTDFLAAVGGVLMGLSIDEIDIMSAEESEGAVNFIDGYWG